MHDATEGGFVAALNELAEASKVGFRIDWEKFAIPEEALALKKHFQLTDEQVLALSSTGTILAAVSPQAREKVEDILKQNNLSAKFIGEFTASKDRILVNGEKEQAFPSVADDPYTRLLATKD